MNRITLSIIVLLIMSIDLYPEENIATIKSKMNTLIANKENGSKDLIKSVDGYIRVGYQQDDNDNSDLALGGKLHIETNAWYDLLVGASFYTTNRIGENDGAGVPFFNADNSSYSILGEAYLKAKWGNTTLKIGRQEIDTPFADTDDIGMIPNTFEAAVLVNNDIESTTLFLAQLQKWSGVDSDTPDHFTKLNDNNGVQVLGITYTGIENTILEGWFYHIHEHVNIGYLETNYERENATLIYSLSVQYSIQDYRDNTKSTIYGISTSLGHKQSGLTTSLSYNKVNGKTADNFFGGGPYFTNAEHHTLSEAGRNGDSILLNLKWDASKIGFNGFILSCNIDHHSNGSDNETREYDILTSYHYSNNLNLTAIYSKIDDPIDSYKNMRIFLNYTF